MKDKEKQIEEMAKACCDWTINCKKCTVFSHCLRVYHAEKIFNAGYRKIDKDSVVLTKEELNKKYVSVEMYELAKAFHDEKCAEFEKLCYDYEKLKQQLKEAQEFWKSTVRTEQEASKETAEKFYKKVRKLLKKVDIIVDGDEGLVGYEESAVDKGLTEIAKQYGVDIEK